MKHNFRKAALSTICMLIVAVMSLTGVTYAWFTAGQQATVNGMNVKVTAADGGVQVRLLNSDTWGAELDLEVEQSGVAPVSSIDGVNFFELGEKNAANSSQAKVASAVKENNNNIIVRKIQLSNPGQAPITVNLNGSSIQKSLANSALDNEIYKAARVALIVTGANNNKTYIYAAEQDTWFGFKAVSNSYITLNTAVDNIAVETTTNLAADCEINLPANPDNAKTENIVTVEIVIWLEGQDVDCKNANAAGAFDITLNFKDKTSQ